MSERRSRIRGVGAAVPPRVVTNDDLAAMMDTSDEWIRQRSGIEQRYWVEGDTTTSDLAAEASLDALQDAQLTASAVDMIILATLSPDHAFPGTACFLQPKLGLTGIPALDIRQQCTGFIYGMAIADQFIRTGTHGRILVVGAEIQSKSLDKTTRGRDFAVLFGDGAGAVVMEACEIEDPDRESHLLSTHLHADGRHARVLWMDAPSNEDDGPCLSHEMLDEGRQYPSMNGRLVFLHASRLMPEAVLEACAASGISAEDVDLFLFHQANLRINRQVGKQLGVEEDRIFNTIQRYGNTTAATIPIGMVEARKAGRLEAGTLVAAAAFGAGFTWASALFRF